MKILRKAITLGVRSEPYDHGDFDYEVEDAPDVNGDPGYDSEYVGEYVDEYDTPAGMFSTPGRIVAFTGSVVVLLVVAGVVAWLLGTRPQYANQNVYAITDANGNQIRNAAGLETAVRVGALAPDFELNDVYTGKPVKLSSFNGRPVWVNFWASWCPPCKAELPDMKQRYDKYRGKGLVLLGVDLREDNATVKQFTQLNSYDWTFVIDSGDVSDRYFVTGIPTHVFVDKTGVIKSMQVGGISGDMMDQALTQIVGQ